MIQFVLFNNTFYIASIHWRTPQTYWAQTQGPKDLIPSLIIMQTVLWLFLCDVKLPVREGKGYYVFVGSGAYKLGDIFRALNLCWHQTGPAFAWLGRRLFQLAVDAAAQVSDKTGSWWIFERAGVKASWRERRDYWFLACDSHEAITWQHGRW